MYLGKTELPWINTDKRHMKRQKQVKRNTACKLGQMENVASFHSSYLVCKIMQLSYICYGLLHLEEHQCTRVDTHFTFSFL